MKHAFLIIAHNNWKQVSEFISAIDTFECDFFIHVNERVDLSEETIAFVKRSAQKSNVIFTRRVPIIWGERGICEASLVLLEDAHKKDKYDYYHLMTGSDLLLKPFEQFDSFMELNINKNMSDGQYKTNYISTGQPTKKILSRVLFYNSFISQWSNPNRFVRKVATLTNSLLCMIQAMVGVNRIKNMNVTLYHGAPWWSISHEFAQYYLDAAKVFLNILGDRTFAIDEFCPATIIENSDFNKSLYSNPSDISRDLRMIDFERGNGYGSPHVWTIEDKCEILKTKNLIGRKFDSNIDSDIVKIIIDKLRG